jgi:hypothetical protein
VWGWREEGGEAEADVAEHLLGVGLRLSEEILQGKVQGRTTIAVRGR